MRIKRDLHLELASEMFPIRPCAVWKGQCKHRSIAFYIFLRARATYRSLQAIAIYLGLWKRALFRTSELLQGPPTRRAA